MTEKVGQNGVSLAKQDNPDLDSEIETTDSADFTDFQEVIGDERTNLFVAKLQGIDNRNLLYPWNLRNLR